MRAVVLLIVFIVMLQCFRLEGLRNIRKSAISKIRDIQKEGPLLGLVVPNAFEMNPLLGSPTFEKYEKLPYLDVGGKRFHFGTIGKQKVVIVMTGLALLNAGTTTQLLLSLFEVKGIVHFGIAGNADPELQIGDVTIPRYWAHTGLWYWQRDGEGPNDDLSLESNGDYTREIGKLNFSDYTVSRDNKKKSRNILNSVWYQPEEIFPVNGVAEVRQHVFWIPVDSYYYQQSQKLESMTFERCANSSTCLPRNPTVARVTRGCSANIFVDNAAYRNFLHAKFGVTPIDMESAAVALICMQHGVRFIAIRSLSDLAGGGSSVSNEASVFAPLASQNAVDTVIQFVTLLE